MNNFIPGAWDNAIKKHAAAMSISWEFLQAMNRRGHSVPAQTEQEWNELQAARRRRFNYWRMLTDELVADGVLDHDSCYECAGELKLNEDRPTDWVWDETEDEYKARMEPSRLFILPRSFSTRSPSSSRWPFLLPPRTPGWQVFGVARSR